MATKWRMPRNHPIRPMRPGVWAWLTRYGVTNGLVGRAKSRWGRIVAVRDDPVTQYKVRRDGIQHASWYHHAYWHRKAR